MIIGIDETGDFDPNKTAKNFFVAAMVDQTKENYQFKHDLFFMWESTIPDRNRDQKTGEVKGKNLTPSQIHEFFFGVFMKPPRTFFNVVEFSPSQNSKELVEKHKRWNMRQMEQAMEQRKNAGQPNWARRYKELMIWYGNSNYQRVAKIENLQNLYCFALQQAFYYAQLQFLLDHKSGNNFDFQFRIDKDFILSTITRNFWNLYQHKFWQIFTKERAPLFFDNEPRLAEAIRKYYVLEENRISFKEPFYGNTIFADSRKHFEIRLADIFGSILHRYHNKGQCQQEWDLIYKAIALEREVPLYTKARFKEGEPPE